MPIICRKIKKKYKKVKNRLFKYDAFNKTTFFNDIKSHYYESHPMINPTGIVPKGPELNF